MRSRSPRTATPHPSAAPTGRHAVGATAGAADVPAPRAALGAAAGTALGAAAGTALDAAAGTALGAAAGTADVPAPRAALDAAAGTAEVPARQSPAPDCAGEASAAAASAPHGHEDGRPGAGRPGAHRARRRARRASDAGTRRGSRAHARSGPATIGVVAAGEAAQRPGRLSHPLVVFGPALAVSVAFVMPVLVGGAEAGGATRLTAVAPAAAAGSASAPVAPASSSPSSAAAGGLDAAASRHTSAPRAARAARRESLAHPAERARGRHRARPAAWVRPDAGPLTSGYGYRPSLGDFHPGIDLAGPYGSPIRAAAAGRIVYAGPASGFGQMVRIAHAGGVVTVYGHMSRILRHSGRVRAGEVFAREGNEGHSTGPHLHFEVWVHGHRVDPQRFLRHHGVRI